MYYFIKDKVLYYNIKALPVNMSFADVVDNLKNNNSLYYRAYDSIHPTRINITGSSEFKHIIAVALVKEKIYAANEH